MALPREREPAVRAITGVTLVPDRSTLTDPMEPPTYTDADLIGRSGDSPDLFAALFDRHAPTLHRYVTRRLGPHVADDLVGQTFLVAFERRERYDPARPDARAWLYGIATNLMRRHLRDEARQLDALARAAAGPGAVPCPAEGIASRVDAGAATRRVGALLAGLPARERDVLLLYAWADLDLDEIGRALDIPAGTVRSRLYRARKRLRPALAGPGTYQTEETIRNG
jgi:RNA polymerase sigma-70 factor (ECF subfamily)